MGDELPIELNLELGVVVGEEQQARGGRFGHDDDGNNDEGGDGDGDKGRSNNQDFDEYYDVAMDFDDSRPLSDDDYEDELEEDGSVTEAVAVKKEEDGEDTDLDEEGDPFLEEQQPSFSSDSIHIKKEEEESDNDDDVVLKQEDKKPPPKVRYIRGPLQSLLSLTTRAVAVHLEKYPPASLSVLSEYQWEGVVKARVAYKKEQPSLETTNNNDEEDDNDDNESPNKEKKKKKRPLIALDGRSTKKRLPPLSEKILGPIEAHSQNSHLALSKTADELIWKEIVNYNFEGVMNRPQSLEVPCEILKGRLRGWGEELLAGVVNGPMSEEEFFESKKMEREKQVAAAAAAGLKQECLDSETAVAVDACKQSSRNAVGLDRNLLFDDEDSEDGDNNNGSLDDNGETNATDNTTPDREMYRQYLRDQSEERTVSLYQILRSLQYSPMDVTLLAETEVGKSASKAAKAMKKLKKQARDQEQEDGLDMDEALGGYPRFWEKVSWETSELQQHQQRRSAHSKADNDTLMTPLKILQQILQDWKDMASDNGVDMGGGNNNKPAATTTNTLTIATCGKHKKMSPEQHRIDMTLLHASPDWRSLYKSLRRREGLMRKAHGDKVRSIRENLQKDRRTVGKVTLKRAVGRVRGSGVSGSGVGNNGVGKLKSPFPDSAKAAAVAAMNQSLRGPMAAAARGASLSQRKEAILSKSRGNRAIQQQQLTSQNNAYSGNSKLFQIRCETKVAASRSKSTFSVASGTKPSSFGASVARAGGTTSGSGARKLPPPGSQVHVQLKSGKHMRLPQSSSAGKKIISSLQKQQQRQQGQQHGQKRKREQPQTGGGGGVFSSLEQKKKKAKLQQQQQPAKKFSSSLSASAVQQTKKMKQLKQKNMSHRRY